ncbi:MAG: hypothetical protein KC421_02545 [Anaerolineales bacterium]|nr:hypothetical protein [Anaerolineales bacterium]
MTKNSNVKSISEIWSLKNPGGKFNDWGERKWIATPSEKQQLVERELTTLKLSPRARELYKAAKLTDSNGVEFVLFSDAQLPAPIGIDFGGLIVPCFLPLNPNNPQSEERQAAMMKRGIFVYDGWVPIDEWSGDKIEQILATLDDIVSLFSVVGKYYARWEPKYIFAKAPATSQLFYEQDLQALAQSLNILDALPKEDRFALSRSVSWLSNALRNAPVQKFLLLFVSIESLATHIESSKTPNTSILKKAFAGETLTKSQKRQEREKCIEEVLAKTKNMTEAVTKAYSECVQKSIKKTLEDHLDRVFGNNEISSIMFGDQENGKTLWLLRNNIAHGNLNMLHEFEIRFIERKVDLLENIARSYLRTIFATLVAKNYFPVVRRPILTLPVSQGIGSEITEYMGPIDMADYYLNIEALSSSYVKVTF